MLRKIRDAGQQHDQIATMTLKFCAHSVSRLAERLHPLLTASTPVIAVQPARKGFQQKPHADHF